MGPENLNLAEPKEVTHKVGVHYWNDSGFGPSYATDRVYLYGELAFEAADVLLQNDELWEVCTIVFPEGNVQPVANEARGPKVIPNYGAWTWFK